MTRHVYLALVDAGGDLGLRDGGYYTLDALRIEQGRRAWGAELGPDETPWQAGLMASVALDKAGGFLGRDALLAARGEVLAKKLVTLVFEGDAYAWGGGTVLPPGKPLGDITPGGGGPAPGSWVPLGCVGGG